MALGLYAAGYWLMTLVLWPLVVGLSLVSLAYNQELREDTFTSHFVAISSSF